MSIDDGEDQAHCHAANPSYIHLIRVHLYALLSPTQLTSASPIFSFLSLAYPPPKSKYTPPRLCQAQKNHTQILLWLENKLAKPVFFSNRLKGVSIIILS